MHIDVTLDCETRTLANGLRLFVHEEHGSPLAAVNVWYHVGSRHERVGRTGLAHLFEHLMFEGSAHVPPGLFDRLLEESGGINNGSTTADRTNYWETVPSSAVELALFLEADRMAGLLDALSLERFEAQRDVVMNERRESYENRPYGLSYETLLACLYPPGHPYHWPVIGFMHDLEETTFDDAASFCTSWYVPDNASIAVAGDVETAHIVELVEQHFGSIPRGPARLPAPPVHGVPTHDRRVLEDNVQLPRLYLAWHSPAAFAPGDAAMDALGHVLAAGKASRLYRALVATGMAIDVSANQHSGQLTSSFEISVTARPGVGLDEIESIVAARVDALAEAGPSEDEMDRVRNVIATSFIDDLQTVGGFGGRADRLNLYEHHLGDPGFAQRDLDRFLELEVEHVREACARLRPGDSVVLSVVPVGRTELSAQ
jgi:zinc protease